MVRRLLVSMVSVFAVLVLTACSACIEQFDPRPDQARFEQERTTAIAAAAAPKLSKTGELPVAGAPTFDIAERYQTLCASCHGASGHGDGAAAAALNPKPRNFADKAWASSVDDARIAKVIKEGGPSVGLSATMAPWGSVLSDAELTAMVAKVRSFGQ